MKDIDIMRRISIEEGVNEGLVKSSINSFFFGINSLQREAINKFHSGDLSDSKGDALFIPYIGYMTFNKDKCIKGTEYAVRNKKV